MLIREAEISDLDSLQELYQHLHETDVLPVSDKLPESVILQELWQKLVKDENYHILLGEMNEKIIASVTLIVIPNLTRKATPYALIENVVTHSEYRKKGYATLLMNEAVQIAKKSGCYKVMLMTSSKKESTLNFYKNCGFDSADKTGFIIRF